MPCSRAVSARRSPGTPGGSGSSDTSPKHPQPDYRFKHLRMEACRTPGLPSVLSHRIWSGGRCDCGFDVIEESLKYQAMKRLDPLTPDRLVLPDRAAFERVAKNRPAFGKLQLEPVLELELIRPDHPERT